MKISRAEKIVESLQNEYTLRIFEDSDPFRVLIRTILSQRTRDENTDAASASLFARYPTPRLIAGAPTENIETLIKNPASTMLKLKGLRKSRV